MATEARSVMRITTELRHCVLRTWRVQDKAALLQHAYNRKVWRNMSDIFPYPYTDADADRWLQAAALPGPSVHLAIDRDGEAIGGIGVIAGVDEFRHTAQFGYWLGEAHWGQGIATAAARAMAALALSGDDFVRLEAKVFAWNPGSMRVLEKAGFVREGVLRCSVFKDGQIIDSVLYARVRDDA
jgi:ribosomal-protein-alanine N-acetyltransferase